jgi:hypothetical protein
MSTTSITSKRRSCIYTVVSITATATKVRTFSIAILPRGDNPFFSDLIQELNHFNPQEILIFNTHALFREEITLREIWTEESLSEGTLVNIAIQESKSPFVFIIWSDMILQAQDISHHLFLRLEERDNLCTTPQLFNAIKTPLPSLTVPVFPPNDIFRVLRTFGSEQEERDNFMSVDYCGVYNRARFLNLGGYDDTLTSSYWQKVEFGLRAAMWGERIVLNSALRMNYVEEPPTDDESTTVSGTLFALKTLGVRIGRKGAYLPRQRFFWLFGQKNAKEIFREIRDWVYENRFRFKYDAEFVVDHWQTELKEVAHISES